MFQDNNGDNIVTNDEVIQRYYYYPFGAETKNAPWTQQSTPSIRYQYNGKEKIDELGLGWNDYGARNYDALLGRWMGVDELAEEQASFTPYHYVYDNPMLLTDPDGRNPILGGIIGGLTEYGTQVATNYIQGNPSPWTTNINATAILASGAEGFYTSGASVAKTLAIKVGVAVFNNTVEVKYGNVEGESGWTSEVKTDPVNIVKNAAIDLTADMVAGSAGGAANKGLRKAAGAVGINNGSMVKVVKNAIKDSGLKVTRATNQAVKANVPKVGNAARKSSGKAVETGVKSASDKKKNEFKTSTNRA